MGFFVDRKCAKETSGPKVSKPVVSVLCSFYYFSTINLDVFILYVPYKMIFI